MLNSREREKQGQHRIVHLEGQPHVQTSALTSLAVSVSSRCALTRHICYMTFVFQSLADVFMLGLVLYRSPDIV